MANNLENLAQITPLDWQSPITDSKTGKPSAQFIRLWQKVFTSISETFKAVAGVVLGLEKVVEDLTEVVEDLVVTDEKAQEALDIANEAKAEAEEASTTALNALTVANAATPEAPVDGKWYARKDATWMAFVPNQGDVVGPSLSVSRSVPLFADTTGKLLTTSTITVDISNSLYLPAYLAVARDIYIGNGIGSSFNMLYSGDSIGIGGAYQFWRGPRPTLLFGNTATAFGDASDDSIIYAYGNDLLVWAAGGIRLRAISTGIEIFGTALVSDDPYSSAWDGSRAVPTKNAVYDKIESLTPGGGGVNVQDEGTAVASATALNFTGAGVTATNSGGGVVQIAIPGGGGGGGGSTPLVRNSGIHNFNASSVVIPFPSGTVAGDVAIVFMTDAYGVTGTPTDWVVVGASTDQSNWNGTVFAKVLTSGDIATGSVTINLGGVFQSVASIITLQGSTVVGIRGIGISTKSSGVTKASVNVLSAAPLDLVVMYASTRNLTTVTINKGSQLKQVSSVNASGVLNAGAIGTQVGGGYDASFASSGTGYYSFAIAMIGP